MTVVIDVRRDDRQAPPRAGAEELSARGVLFVHSCASAVAPHLEWALARVFGTAVNVDWSSQPIAPGSVRAEIIWHGPQGTAAKIASALVSFSTMRFEVSEDPSAGVEGERRVPSADAEIDARTVHCPDLRAPLPARDPTWHVA